MSNQISDEMLQQLLQLPYEQRDQLANTLIQSLHPTGESIDHDAWQAAWISECHRRSSQVESGNVSVVLADELIARMRAKHSE